MFFPSVYDHHNMDLIPPSFIDHQGHELPDLLLAPPPVNSSDVDGRRRAPPDTLTPRNIGSSVSRSNVRLPARKDRHSKISTAQGLRDRRVRLSVGISRRFFDLQDMLGFDKASKTLEWLLGKSADSIEKLAKTSKDVINNYNEGTNTSPSSTSSFGSLDYVAVSANGKEKMDKPMPNISSQKSVKTIAREESRAKARARARERTREKLLDGHFRALSGRSEGNAHNLPASPCHNVDATGEHQVSRCELEVMMQSMATRGKPSSILGYHHENIVISSSKNGNNFNNVENFFPNLQPQQGINVGISVNTKADLMSMDNLEKLIAANELNKRYMNPN